MDATSMSASIEKRPPEERLVDASGRIHGRTDAEKVRIWRRLDFIIENGESNHPYVKKWLSMPWMSKIRSDPNFYTWRNLTGLSKEMTESYSAFKQIKRLLKLVRQHRPLEEEQLVFFDICSGKGVLSTLLSFMFPKCQIFMLDKNGKMNNDHLLSQPNVHFEKLNVKDPKFKAYVAEKAKMGFSILLGIHLCGFLSEVLIDLYNTIDDAKVVILSPCCFNSKRLHLLEEARITSWAPYNLWTRELFTLVQGGRKEAFADANMQSDKNNYIVSIKDSVIPSSDTSTLRADLPPHIVGDPTYKAPEEVVSTDTQKKT